VRSLTLLLLPAVVVAGLAGCSGPPSDIAPCSPDDVRATIEIRQADTGDGVVAVNLVVTNYSEDWCRLDGAPTVRIISVKSVPVGQAATTMVDRSVTPADLASGETAYALLETTKAMPDFVGCEEEFAQGISVVLPGFAADTALVLPSPVAQYCDIPDLDTLLVSGFATEPPEGHDSRDADG
jgi:hypothetical protein